mgnify:CR=1 FL=1
MRSVTALRYSGKTLRTAIPLVVVAGLVAVKVFEHYIFYSGYDTAIYSNLAWNIAHGKGYFSDVLGRHHLGEHFSPVMFLFAPLYRLFPTAQVLMAAMGIAVGATFALLIPLGRIIFGDLAPRRRTVLIWCLPAVFLLYRPVQAALLSQFHPSTLGMPLIAGVILCLHTRRNAGATVLTALLLTTKENAILAVFGLSIYSLLVLRRGKPALILALTGAVAAPVVFGLVMPAFRDGSWGHVSRLAPFAFGQRKLVYLLRLLLPLGFLPLLGWRALLAAVPLIALNLLVSYEPQFSIIRHYDDMASVFLIVAAMHGARLLLLLPLVERTITTHGRTIVRAAVALAVPVALIIGWEMFHMVKRKTPDLTRGGIARIQRMHEQIARCRKMPERVRILTHSELAPYLCHRARISLLWPDSRHKDYDARDRIVFTPWLCPSFEQEDFDELLASDVPLYVIERNEDLTVYGVRP